MRISLLRYFFLIMWSFILLVGCKNKELTLLEYSNESQGFTLHYPSENWEILQEEDGFVVLVRSSFDESGGEDLDAVVVVHVMPAKEITQSNPSDYLTEFSNGKQTACDKKQIVKKEHPIYTAMGTCIDFTLEGSLGPLTKVEPFKVPSEFTVLMDSSHVAKVTYVHSETSAEIHRKEVEAIISSLTFN